MPENTLYVGRGSKWGNPFTVEQYGREKAVQMFRDYIGHQNSPHGFESDEIEELRGKNLACWCREDQACHADVLIEYANTYPVINRHVIFINFEMVITVPSADQKGLDYCATVDVQTGGLLTKQTTRRYIARRHHSYWYYTDTGKYVRPAHAIDALAEQWLEQHQSTKP